MKRIALVLTAFITFAMLNETQAQSTKVLIKTTLGDITVMLYDDTPIHRDNMLELIKKNVYDGTLFHRVIKGFMVQGGDPTSKDAKPGQQLGSGGPGYTIPAEFKPNHYHKKGALAAARQGDQVNPQKASSGSQFYIVQGNVMSVAQLTQMESTGQHPKFTEEQKKAYTTVGGTPFLDYQYTVYGEVTAGLDVIDKIAAVETSKPGDRPKTDVKIISVSVVK
jgi:peptidyl-prolyl cis-trans isomerase B (cyclophilin B)